MNIEQYQQVMRRQARHHGTEGTMLTGYGAHLSPKQQRKLKFHQTFWLASVYGCSPHSVRRFVDSFGDLDLRGIDDARRSALVHSFPTHSDAREHRVHVRWMDGLLAVDEVAKMGHRELSLQLRGVSRALWLAALWADQDVSSLRKTWYHWTDTEPYWHIAWACYTRQYGFERLLAFARGLLWRYSELHPARRVHAAAKYVEAAERMQRAFPVRRELPYPVEAA